MIAPLHPYFPEGIELSGNEYVPNTLGAFALVLVFAAGCVVILGSSLIAASWANPRMSRSDGALVLWFVLCE